MRLYTFNPRNGTITPGVRHYGSFPGPHAHPGLYLSRSSAPTLDESSDLVIECSFEQGGGNGSTHTAVAGASDGKASLPMVWVNSGDKPPTRVLRAQMLQMDKLLEAWGDGHKRVFSSPNLEHLAASGYVSVESGHVVFIGRDGFPRTTTVQNFLVGITVVLRPIYDARQAVASKIRELTFDATS